MVQPLKEILDERAVRAIAGDLRSAYAPFDAEGFVERCLAGLSELELMARARHVASAMHEHLPRPFPRAAEVIAASFGPELDSSGHSGLAPLRYLPHVVFVAEHGLPCFEEAMALQRELTKRFTAEWSLRPFLVRYPDATHARLVEWARDPNVHVRRLVSEGTRPRLPWASRLRAYQEDPTPVLSLLELLKDDPERYVQRSVANNLNDIAKDHPELVVELCRRWSEGGRRWIVERALRTLVKRGHPGALAVLGYGGAPRVRLERVRVPRRARLGDRVRFSFDVVSTTARPQELLVDFAVHFVKADGSRRPKVFKLAKVALAPRGRERLEAELSLARMTTRRHYAGRHVIDVLINGVAHPLGELDVRP